MKMQWIRPMKRILSLVLCAAMLISLFPGLQLGTQAAADDLVYEIADGKVTITGYQSGLSGALTIPATIEGYPVTAIGDSAFSGCEGLTGVTIPDSVTDIGEWTFSYCTSLTRVTLPTGITRLGDAVFSACTSLADVTIPDGVTTIGLQVFYDCESLTSITIPNSVTSIGDTAFAECTGLTCITISDSVTDIGAYAFDNCTGLTSVTIPDSVTSIGDCAFFKCTALDSVFFTGDAPSFGYAPFMHADGTALWYISGTTGWDSVTVEALTGGYGTLTLRETEHVDENADNTCDRCGTVLAEPVPEGLVYEIADGQVTITDCDSSLTGELIIPATIEGYPVTAIGDWAFGYCYDLTGLTLPDSVTDIGRYAFYYCSGLTSVTIPNSVTSIGEYAFSVCTSLTGVAIPDSIARIEAYTFCNCTRLTGVTIPDSVTSIGEDAFSNCTSLTGVTIPASVTSIGNGAFSGCTNLTGITVAENNPSYSNDVWGVLHNKDKTQLLHMPAGFSGTYTIAESVTEIGDGAFYDCSGMTGVTIPNSVTTIGEEAFYYCSGLNTVTIPASVTQVGDDAFSSCWGLTDIYFAGDAPRFGYTPFMSVNGAKLWYITGTSGWDSVSSQSLVGYFGYINIQQTDHVDENADGKCDNCGTVTGNVVDPAPEGLTYEISGGQVTITGCDTELSGELTIPSTIKGYPVTAIGTYAFVSCNKLTGITISEGVTSIGDSAFMGCDGLTEVSLPESLVSIGNLAFIDCGGLTQLTIPDGVTTIGNDAFTWCDGLTTVTMGSSVTTIGKNAFYSCTALSDVYFTGDAPSFGTTAFGYVTNAVLWFSCAAQGWEAVYSQDLTGGNGSVTLYQLDHVDEDLDHICDRCEIGLVFEEPIPQGLIYEINNGEVTIIGYDDSLPADLIIPDTIEGCPVVAIGDYAFAWCESLTDVTIPDGVTYIGAQAFADCHHLTNITIPGSVTDMGWGVFSYCTGLTNVILPDSITTMDGDTFYYCTGLTYVTLPSSITAIPGNMFNGCSSLVSVEIPSSVTSIGWGAFSFCSSLTSVTLPDGITAIEGDTFYSCSSLTDVNIPDGVLTIGYYAFGSCTALRNLTIPASVIFIEYDAFYYCTAENVYFEGEAPVSVEGAFDYAEGVNVWYPCNASGWEAVTGESLTGGNGSVTLRQAEHIDENTDGVCDLCNDVLVAPEPIPEGLQYAIMGEEVAITGCDADFSGELVIPAVIEGYPVTSIQYGAFMNRTGMTGIVIPETVTLIGSYAFMNCSELTSVIIPDGVTIIGDNTFNKCSSLTSVTIPDSVTAIGAWAFSRCSQLADITIPENVTFIGEGAFCRCSGLTDITILEGVTSIGKQAFDLCTGLTNITIPNSVTDIGDSAFYGCTGLTDVTISDGVTSIGNSAFYNCTGLTNVTIPGSVTAIGDYAFCFTGLTTITFAGDVPTFGDAVFGEVNATVWYPCNAQGWENVIADYLAGGNGSISICMAEHIDEDADGVCEICGNPLVEVPEGLIYEINNGEVTITGYDYRLPNELIIPPMIEGCPVTAIGDSAFLYNGNLTSVTICDTIRSIGQDAFYGCGSITEIIVSENNPYFTSSADGVLFNKDQTRLIQMPAAYEGAYTIPNSVKIIGRRAFAFCFGLMELTIPDGVTSIEYGAFICCERLTSLVIPDSVTEIQGSAFYSCVDLTEIELSDNVTFIGENAFIYCDSLTSIVIPASVTTIGDGAFYDCTDLSEIYFEGDAPNFGGSLFNHDEYEDITLRRHCGADGWASVNFELLSFNRGRIIVQKVHRYVDEQCTVCGAVDYDQPVPFGLMYEINNREVTITGYEMGISSELVIPEYIEGYPVVAIADYAFYHCEYLYDVVLPNRLTTIGEYAFSNSNVNYVTLSDSVTSIGAYAFAHSSIIEVTLSAGLTEMGDYAFAWCNQLSRVIMPNGMTCIGDYAFVQCYYLSSINFPGSITEIGRHAFEGCGHLTSVTIPQGVASIGDYAFYECFGLESVSIPKSVTYIGLEAFSGCRMLTEIVVSENNTVYCSDVDGVLFTKDKTQLIQMPAGSIGTYTIPDTVSIIGERAFYYSNITEVTIGSGVTYIGYHAFACSALENIIFEGNPPMFSYAVFDYVNATLWFPCWATEWRNITSNDLHGGSGYISLQNKAHSFTNYVSNGDATCTQDGTKTAKCDYCDDIDIIIDVGSGGKHTLMFVPEVVSCTESGNIAHYRCEGCGKLFADGTALVELTAAEVWKAPVGHTEVVDPAVEPGCMTDGLTEGKHCCVCGTVLVPQIPIGSLGHSYEPQVVLPTYFEQGYTLHICSVCGDSYKDTYVEALQRVELSQAELKLEYTSAYYQGRPLTPGVTLTYQGDVLDAYKELKLTYANNDKVGVATVTVEGINQFVGTVQLTFEISYEVIPQPIVNVFAVGEIGKISVSWGQSSEVNTDRYNIYRKAENEESYQLITTVYGREVLSWEDRNVEREKTYSYYVTGVGLYGAESEPSQVVMATVQVDKTAPTVLKITPAAASVIAGSTKLSAVVRDNVAVTKVVYLYTLDNGETWLEIGETANSDFSILFDTSKLEAISVKVKALAYDAEGNESDPRTVVYSLDNVGPEKVTGLSAFTLSSKITLSWKDVEDNDAAYFILQTLTEDGWKLVASNIKTLGYTITGLKGDTDYTYRVACVDTHGNVGQYSDAFTARTAWDMTAPVITQQSPNAARFNQSIGFSATAKDDCDIQTLAIQVSTDLSSWTTLSTQTYTARSFSQTYAYTIDLSGYADGSLYVRAIATDFAGNMSNTGADAPYTEYFVDRTAPKAPADVVATGNDGYITLSWSLGSEADLGKYFVYRATSEDGEYQLIASNLASVNYHDRDVTRGSQYYYKVAVSDSCGNMSPSSVVVFGTMSADTRRPEITGMSTTYQQKISPSSHKIYVAATDNNQLSRIIVEYCTSVDPQYKLLAMEENIGTYSKSIPVELPIEGLNHGAVIYLRAYAVDMAGLRSENQTAKYTLDLTAPQASDYTANVEGSKVTLTWKDQGEEDLSGFKVYRSVAGGSFRLLGSRGANSSGSYTFADTITAKESNTYVYQLEAIDKMGNTASWQKTVYYVYVETEEAPDEYVNQAPIPQMTIPTYMMVDVEEIFDASGSVDDIGITEYLWDFGDGTYSRSMKPIKSYAAAGSYLVTLIVTDTEGCTASVSGTVEVKPRDMLGVLNVKVVDENGKALPYVPVYFDLGSENQTILYTNGLGEVGMQLPGGTHTVGMYATGYLPVKKDVVVLANATRNVTLTTVEEEIVTGNFEITRMTFDEIVAAGIDVYDPANQNVYSATVRVTYGASSPLTIDYYRNDNEILSYTVKDTYGNEVKEYKSANGENRKITGVTYIPSKKPTAGGVGPGTGTSQQPDVVAIVDIPASASYLKEFFDVRLHIVNNASPEFVLENNEVALNVPEGLTLMSSVVGGYQTSPHVSVPFIRGQETVTLAWVLRGDQAGEYDLSADFTGTLAEFDEVVTATFETEEAIKVYGLEGVKFRILAADKVHNDTLYFNVELENQRDIDIYMPAIGLTDKIMNMTESVLNGNASGDYAAAVYLLNAYVQTGKGAKLYQPVTIDANGRVETPVKVLAPGQKLVVEYVAYNAINYNGVAEFKEAAIVEFEGLLENIEVGTFEKELYSFKDYSSKLDDMLTGANPDAAEAKDYIINDGNFYYANEAEKISDTALKNLYKIANTVLEGDLSVLTQDEERDLIQRILLSVLSHESVTRLSEDFMMDKYNQAVVSMIDKVKIGTINSFVGDGITGENISEAFANIAKDSAELAATYREKGAEAFNKELSQRVAGAGLGITIDAGAMLALGGEAEAFSSVLDGGKDLVKSMFTAAQESEREALYFAVLKYNCNAEIAEIILDAVIKNTEDCLLEELNWAIAAGWLPMGAGILALRDVGLGEKTLIWQTAKDMKKTLESDRESFYGSIQDIMNYVEDGAAAAASLAIKALVKGALGSTPVAIVSAGFKIIDVVTGWGSYTKQEDAMEIYKACSDAFLGAYRDSIATRNEETDFYSMTYLRALTEIRLQGEQQYKAFVDDYLKGVHVAPMSEETVLKELNKQMNTNYATIDEWWDAVQYNAVHARDVMFNLEYAEETEIPRAPVVTLDYDRLQTVQTFSSAYEYCFADGVWKSCENAPISFEVGVTPSTLRVRWAASEGALAGEITTVKIYARKDLSKLIDVRFDGKNYEIRNLSNAYYYQVLFTNAEDAPMDWGKALKIAGGDAVTVSGVGAYAYMIIRSCQNTDRQETTSNPLTCQVKTKQKLTLEIEGRGSVFQTEKSGYYFSGDTIDLVAMPVADTVFRGWFIGNICVSIDPHYLLEMTEDLQIKAVFEGSGVRDVVIGSLPQKLEYRYGEPLDLQGLEVMVTYEDGTTVSTEHYTACLTSSAVGESEVEITFGLRTVRYGVTILCGTPEENNPMGHTLVIDEAVKPTCTTTGLTEGKHCSVCHEILEAQEVIPVGAHSYENSVCIHCGVVDPAARITGLTCVGTTRTSIDLTWDVLGMDAIYWVYVDGMVYGCTTGTRMTVEGRRPGEVYSVAVIAQLKDAFLSLTKAETISVITEAYSFSSTAQAGVHSVTINWEAKDGTRAWLLYGTSPDALTVYTSSEDGTFTKDQLKANTTYYFQVAYLIGDAKPEGGLVTTLGEVVYGDVFQVTTGNDDRLNVTREGRKLTWNVVEGSTKYWVVVTIDGKTYTFTTLEPAYTIGFFTDGELDRATIVVKGLNCNGVFDYNPLT